MTRRIICDLDSIVVDLTTSWFNKYNELYQDDLRMENVLSWDTHLFAKHGMEIYKILEIPGFFANLDPLPGAVEALRTISKSSEQFELLLVTACANTPAYTDKALWVQKHLPFIPLKKLVMMNQKHLIEADIMIDDSPHKITAMRFKQDRCKILTIAYPYNKEVAVRCDLRAEGWQDTAAAWKQILEYLGLPA